MVSQEYWIYRGGLVPRPEDIAGEQVTDNDLLSFNGYVHVQHDETCTQVSWHCNAPNFASLYFAKEWIGTFAGPYRLKYFLNGWFVEDYDDPVMARNRIDVLIAKSDTLLTSRVYVKEFDPKHAHLPDLLRRAYEQGSIPPSLSVDCVQDPKTSRFKVDRIGQESAIGQMWGMSPMSYPCLSGNSYDEVVGQAYAKVLATHQPNYSHVYAAMVKPDGEVHWIPYQRIVLPGPKNAKLPTVTVVSEFTPVEILVV